MVVCHVLIFALHLFLWQHVGYLDLYTQPVFVAVCHLSGILIFMLYLFLWQHVGYLDLYTPPVSVPVCHIWIFILHLFLCQYVISGSLHSTCLCARMLYLDLYTPPVFVAVYYYIS